MSQAPVADLPSLQLGDAGGGPQRTASQAQLTSRSFSDAAGEIQRLQHSYFIVGHARRKKLKALAHCPHPGRRTRMRGEEDSTSETVEGNQGAAAGHSTELSGPQVQGTAAIADQPSSQDSGVDDHALPGMQQSAQAEEEPGHEEEEEEHADALSVQADDQPEEPFYASSDGEGEGIPIESIGSLLQ